MTTAVRSYAHIPSELSRDERAKLSALGGVAWIRQQLAATPMPNCERTLTQLTDAERDFAITSTLAHKRIARELNVNPTAITQLRSRARRQAMSQRVAG